MVAWTCQGDLGFSQRLLRCISGGCPGFGTVFGCSWRVEVAHTRQEIEALVLGTKRKRDGEAEIRGCYYHETAATSVAVVLRLAPVVWGAKCDQYTSSTPTHFASRLIPINTLLANRFSYLRQNPAIYLSFQFSLVVPAIGSNHSGWGLRVCAATFRPRLHGCTWFLV